MYCIVLYNTVMYYIVYPIMHYFVCVCVLSISIDSECSLDILFFFSAKGMYYKYKCTYDFSEEMNAQFNVLLLMGTSRHVIALK